MKKIILIMAYFGKLPNYYPVWLESVKNNPTVDFMFISDCIEAEKLPPNVKLLNITGDEFKERVQDKFDFKVSIENYGRVSQFRPAFAYIFPEIVEGYDYWGYVECDLILGDIRAFLTDDVLNNYDRFFRLGHMQLFKNSPEINTLFKRRTKSALNYKYAYSKDVLFFEEILGMTNIANAHGVRTYAENVFSDLNMFELMFTRSTFTYDNLEPEEQLFEYNNGKLYCYYIEQGKVKKREILYAHFQKRAMDVQTEDYNKYIIIPNCFTKWKQIDGEIFDSVKKSISVDKDDYKKQMQDRLHRMKIDRMKKAEWLYTYLIRLRVFIFGGIDFSGRSWKKYN